MYIFFPNGFAGENIMIQIFNTKIFKMCCLKKIYNSEGDALPACSSWDYICK